MKAVIDTNILIDFLHGIEEAQAELHHYSYPIISIITWMEVCIGARTETERRLIEMFLKRFKIEGVHEVIAREAVAIRQASHKKLPDAIIEATAITHETLLVTRNTRDFDPCLPHIRLPYTLTHK